MESRAPLQHTARHATDGDAIGLPLVSLSGPRDAAAMISHVEGGYTCGCCRGHPGEEKERGSPAAAFGGHGCVVAWRSRGAVAWCHGYPPSALVWCTVEVGFTLPCSGIVDESKTRMVTPSSCQQSVGFFLLWWPISLQGYNRT